MAVFVLTDASVTINAVNLSGLVKKVTVKTTADDKDSTAMGATYKARLGGLKDWTMDIEFNQDFGASQVDATLFPLLGTNSTVTAKSTSAANSATNPQYSGSALLKGYTPLQNTVGDLAAATANFVGAGTLSRLLV